jgi:hypothetical protein
VRVAVIHGAAQLESPFGRTSIRSGHEARATAGSEPSLPYGANVSAYDPFDRWVDDQRDYRIGRVSTQYLPAEIRHYGGTFDRYGSWEHAPGYGYVWYPRVAVGWQPYYDGGWSFVGSFGWTWIGAGRWTWPTHHYGRWGYGTGRWFWIPGRRWAPAWVSWGHSPGYVSWCPLGFDNRPVFSITNINVYHSGRRHGWSVVPTNVFVSRAAFRGQAAVGRSLQLPAGTRFVTRASAPVRPAGTLRSSAPLRAPTAAGGRYAVARGSRAVDASGDRVAPPPRSTVTRSRAASSQPAVRTTPADASRGSRAAVMQGRARSEYATAAPSTRQPVIRSAPSRAPVADSGDRSPSAPTARPRASSRWPDATPVRPSAADRAPMERRQVERSAPLRVPAPDAPRPGGQASPRATGGRPAAAPSGGGEPTRRVMAPAASRPAPERPSTPRVERSRPAEAPASSGRARPRSRSGS